jgi:hypothetical protein
LDCASLLALSRERYQSECLKNVISTALKWQVTGRFRKLSRKKLWVMTSAENAAAGVALDAFGSSGVQQYDGPDAAGEECEKIERFF